MNGASMGKADTVRSAERVEWVRRDSAYELFGVGRDVLDRWVSKNLVEAHKLHSGRNGSVVFSADDIRMAICGSPAYKPGGGEDKETKGFDRPDFTDVSDCIR